MLPKINLTETKAYSYLPAQLEKMTAIDLKDLFKTDPERFNKFSVLFEDILLDYSKNRIDDETLALLLQVAKECRLNDAITAM